MITFTITISTDDRELAGKVRDEISHHCLDLNERRNLPCITVNQIRKAPASPIRKNRINITEKFFGKPTQP